MGLREEITSGLADAFDDPDALADAVKPFTGSRLEGGAYDVNTGKTGGTPLTYIGRGVFGSYALQDIDGTKVLATDTKLIALQAEVTGTPKIGDRIGSQTVKNVGKDPADATWILQLRG